MKLTTDKTNGQALGLDAINWVAADPLTRDMEQSRRLHEPESMITTIDPITGATSKTWPDGRTWSMATW